MKSLHSVNLIVIGGGAAGIFTAIQAAAIGVDKIVVLEGSPRFLSKVKVSGGGRCNVTHHCFDPKKLVSNYPRGSKELIGPMHQFGPEQMCQWLQAHGVELKVEADGRMFPTTDSSQTIIDCFIDQARKLKVDLVKSQIVKKINRVEDDQFIVETKSESFIARNIMLATGSSPLGFRLAQSLGHHIVKPMPSLFSFEMDDRRISGLSGISFSEVELLVYGKDKKFKSQGPLLITHWGMSGPAVLRLSAFAARELYQSGYQAQISINFAPKLHPKELKDWFLSHKKQHGKKFVVNTPHLVFPKRYWQQLCEIIFGSIPVTFAECTKEHMQQFEENFFSAKFLIRGKGVFKDEFVTAGGIPLQELSFKDMQSKKTPGVFFAGEILDIDGVTGGFNFQNAWTGGFLAARGIARKLKQSLEA